MEGASTSTVLPPNPQPQANHEESIRQNPVESHSKKIPEQYPSKSVKVMKKKQTPRNCHSQELPLDRRTECPMGTLDWILEWDKHVSGKPDEIPTQFIIQ